MAQQHPLTAFSLARLERAVLRCDGLIVLFAWDFFERLCARAAAAASRLCAPA